MQPAEQLANKIRSNKGGGVNLDDKLANVDEVPIQKHSFKYCTWISVLQLMDPQPGAALPL